MSKMVVSAICNKHGYHKGGYCPKYDICGVGEETFYTSKDQLWTFTDYDITGKPIEIRSKGQYDRLMKQHGKYQITSVKDVEVEKKRYDRNLKEKHKERVHDAAVSAYKDIKQMGGDRRVIGWR